MKRTYTIPGVVAGLLLLGPVGLRVATWERPEPEAIDPAQAKAGGILFNHEWQPNDPLSPNGDGLGPVFNAKSCVACHFQGGVGGSSGLDHNVTTYVIQPIDRNQVQREGVIHAHATSPEFRETLKLLDPALPPVSQPKLEQLIVNDLRGDIGPGSIATPNHIQLSQRNTPALFGARLIDAIPDRVIIAQEHQQRAKYALASSDSETFPIGRAHRLPSGGVGRFGWKAQMARLNDFVVAACANELGLGNPREAQPVSLAKLDYKSAGLDLTQAQCDEITAFVASLPTGGETAGR